MTKKPHPIDVHVGSRIRLRRTLLGMSQEKLGEALGLTFQQVQKYERGANRVGSSRLFEIATVLNVPVSFFFDDIPSSTTGELPEPGKAADSLSVKLVTKRETLDLIRGYYHISDPAVRRHVIGLVRALGDKETVALRE